jgi:integrase
MSERHARESGPKRDPRTGTWGFVVDVGVGENGKRKQARRRGFKTKKDAQSELDRLRTRVAQQTYVAPKRETVAEYLDEWLAAIEHTVRPSTFSSYKRNVRVHVKSAIGAVQLQRLDAAHLNRMYGALRGRLSVRTVRYIHTIVHRALRDAVKWGRVVRNVADAADPPRAKDARTPEMQTWSAAELARFLGAVQGSRHRSAWLVIATTGMRRGECLGLRWRDVDLDAGRLSIRQQVIAVDNRIVVSPSTKSGKARAIDLDAPTLAEFRAHKARQAQELLSLGIRQGDDTLVFSKLDGRPYDPDNFSREFTRARTRRPELQLPAIRLHDLRHTWATLALGGGVPTKIVSERLGHRTTGITENIYSHVTPTMQVDAASKVAAMIFGTDE